MGLPGYAGLVKTYSPTGDDFRFHACRTSQAYCESGVGSVPTKVESLQPSPVFFPRPKYGA